MNRINTSPVHVDSTNIQHAQQRRSGSTTSSVTGRSQRRRAPQDGALRHWLDSFHFLHTEGETYTPVALRLVPPDCGSGKGVARGSGHGLAGPIVADRGVYEVALRRDARGARWVLILWEVDVPGIHFCDCADRDEAMALFAEPSKAAGRWQGVRLAADSRPW